MDLWTVLGRTGIILGRRYWILRASQSKEKRKHLGCSLSALMGSNFCYYQLRFYTIGQGLFILGIFMSIADLLKMISFQSHFWQPFVFKIRSHWPKEGIIILLAKACLFSGCSKSAVSCLIAYCKWLYLAAFCVDYRVTLTWTDPTKIFSA